MTMAVDAIGVIGAGTMGSGIAQTAAASGLRVILADVSLDIAERALGAIASRLERSVARGKLSERERTAILDRIHPAAGTAAMAEVDYVIEAVFEDVGVKQAAFRELDRCCRPETVLASNTSSISITEIAAAAQQPERVVGMHFFFPAPVMRLVEVVRGARTADATVAAATAIAERLGKTPVQVRKDTAGFIVNRLLFSLYAEACRLVDEGIASPAEIDMAVTAGLNHPMGPFRLMDVTGIDVIMNAMEYVHRELARPQYAPPGVLRRLVRAGRIGEKAGAGWFDYGG